MYYLQQAENAGAQITAICDMDPKAGGCKKVSGAGREWPAPILRSFSRPTWTVRCCAIIIASTHILRRAAWKGHSGAFRNGKQCYHGAGALRCAAQRKRPEAVFACWRRIIPLCAPILSLKGFTMRKSGTHSLCGGRVQSPGKPARSERHYPPSPGTGEHICPAHLLHAFPCAHNVYDGGIPHHGNRKGCICAGGLTAVRRV